jgi:hypothetical protein
MSKLKTQPSPVLTASRHRGLDNCTGSGQGGRDVENTMKMIEFAAGLSPELAKLELVVAYNTKPAFAAELRERVHAVVAGREVAS